MSVSKYLVVLLDDSAKFYHGVSVEYDYYALVCRLLFLQGLDRAN